SIFPWDRIQALSSITATLVSSIQFPNRFLTIATVCLTVLVGIVYRFAQRSMGNRGRSLSFVSVGVLVFISSIFLMNDTIFSSLTFQIYDEECLGSGYVAGGEYLPYGSDPELFVQRDPVTEGDVVVNDYEKDGLHIKISCSNQGAGEGAMELGLLYYKGYQAKDMETKEAFPVYMGNNCVVGVTIPANYQGTIEVEFVSPWYWRVAELISVVVFAAFCVDYVLRRKIL
ncbi:MAG: hypothetical protein IJF07_09365, partial [Lachnospiraceae bacterium]|nr:hypothetical protein [Lachnospiraceae bacterium]